MNKSCCKIFTIIIILAISEILSYKIRVRCPLPNGELGNCVPTNECDQENKNLTKCGIDLSLICCDHKRNVGEISRQKCHEVYSNRYDFITLGGGGYNAFPNQYPHMAALGYGEWKDVNWACGGSLISDNFILTAAHCIQTILGPLRYIRLGVLKLRTYDRNAVPRDYNVTKTYVHPDFKPPSHYNDIALVEIGYVAWELYGNIAPACLQTERKIPNSHWSATGWGETSHNGPSADHLQVMDLEEADYEVCGKAFNITGSRKLSNGIDDESQICAGHGKIDTCQGDSGGPLQFRNLNYPTGHTVIGITSFGKACVLTNKPGVYTRVSHYIEWIESIVWEYF